MEIGFCERHGWEGLVTVVHRDLSGRVLHVAKFRNLITNAGLDLISDALRSGADAEIKYMAWGLDNTAPAVTDTALGNENGRKQITSTSDDGTGVGTVVTYLGPQDANVAIEELGWFAGAATTGTPGSGVMVARVLYSRSKTNLESIQVDRTDTFT